MSEYRKRIESELWDAIRFVAPKGKVSPLRKCKPFIQGMRSMKAMHILRLRIVIRRLHSWRQHDYFDRVLERNIEDQERLVYKRVTYADAHHAQTLLRYLFTDASMDDLAESGDWK